MIPTISRDERGWWVTLVAPDGVTRRVGPFTRKGDVTAFLLRLWHPTIPREEQPDDPHLP